MSFVCEHRWKPTDLGVTPKDFPTDKNTKIGGCLYFCQYHNIHIGVQIIKYKIFQIKNLTTFFTSGGNRALIYTISGKCVCWILQYNNCGKNLCKFIGDLHWTIIFTIRLKGCLSLGATPPISFWAEIYVFLAVIYLLDITYFSKCYTAKTGGCLYFCQYHNIHIGVQIIKYEIFQIENLTTIFTSGGNRALIYTISGKCVCWILQYNNCGKNLCKFIGDFLLDHYFHNKIEGVPVTRGHTPCFVLG